MDTDLIGPIVRHSDQMSRINPSFATNKSVNRLTQMSFCIRHAGQKEMEVESGFFSHRLIRKPVDVWLCEPST
jgi:hypothetical protein